MPRHDRAYGRWHAPGKKGGTQRRKQPTHAMGGRKDGNTDKSGSKPQAPKPVKGGSKQGK